MNNERTMENILVVGIGVVKSGGIQRPDQGRWRVTPSH
jgi:hypothetical protein